MIANVLACPCSHHVYQKVKFALQLHTCDVCLFLFFMTKPPVLIFFSFTSQGLAADRGNVGWPPEEDSW